MATPAPGPGIGWTITGNAGIDPHNDFLGTIDSQPLAFRTNNQERARIDSGGNVGIGTTAPKSPLQIRSLTALSEGATAAGAWANFGSNRYYDGSWQRIDPSKAGVNLHMNADDGVGQEFRFQRVEADGSNSRNIGTIGTKTSFIAAGNFGIDTTSPQKPLDIAGTGGIRISQTAEASSENELYFADNGQIRSLDDNHRIIFNRSGNELELRELGNITFSAGATQGQRTATVMIFANGLLLANGNFSVNGMAFFSNNVGIALNESDVQRDGEPTSALVVRGDIRTLGGDVLLAGADCAEDFDVAGDQSVEPGTVVVIDEGGALRESQEAYDKKVAGVVSGAGEYKHGLVLDKRSSSEGRIPVALVGKVYCKVDAQYAPIEVGDLLTTSPTPGHAMKAVEPIQAYGSIIGKALRPVTGGQGLIPILVALQ